MDKLIEFIKNADWKHLAISAVLLATAAACSFFLSSCGTSWKVQGNRKVEKTIIHEQQYELNGSTPAVLTSHTTYQSIKKRS